MAAGPGVIPTSTRLETRGRPPGSTLATTPRSPAQRRSGGHLAAEGPDWSYAALVDLGLNTTSTLVAVAIEEYLEGDIEVAPTPQEQQALAATQSERAPREHAIRIPRTHRHIHRDGAESMLPAR